MGVPGGAVHIAECIFLEDARAIDRERDRSQLGLGFSNQGDGCGFLAQVASEQRSLAAPRANFRGGGLRLVIYGADMNSNVIAGVGCSGDKGATDPPRAAGNQRSPAVSHGWAPARSVEPAEFDAV